MKAIIIGGGIAGLSTALALQKQKIQTEVYESAVAFKPVGAGILLAPNGMEVLKRLDKEVFAVISQKANPIKYMCIENYKGQLLAKSEFQENQDCVAIHRADLIQTFADFLPKDALKTNKKFGKLIVNDGRVEVSFEDKTEARGDFLIGADGIHSQVRQNLFGELPYRYSGQTCWRAVIPFSLPKPYKNRFTEIWGKQRGRRVGFGMINQHQLYFYATQYAEAAGKDDINTIKTDLLNLFKEFPSLVKDFMSELQAENIMRNDIYDIAPHDKWLKNKAVLVGDAAHATTPNMGQGGNQALESAWVLGQCFSKDITNLESGLQNYQRLRIKKAHKVINDSWRISQMMNIKNPLLKNLRHFAIKATPTKIANSQMQKVYNLDYVF